MRVLSLTHELRPQRCDGRVGGRKPLLARWRYGLGKSVAFTSDLSGRWGRDWVQWKDFVRFAAQMARWSMRRRGSENLHAQFREVVSAGGPEVLVQLLAEKNGSRSDC